MVWTAFCADGSCLPPVIFTKDDPGPPQLRNARGEWYTDGNRTHYAFVHRVRKCAPSHLQTAQWVKDLTSPDFNFLGSSSNLILDKAPYHTDSQSSMLWGQLASKYNTSFEWIPAAGGKWVNPCDQAIHRELRRNFHRLMVQRPQHHLANLISAYYAISEECVRGAWRHTRLLSGEYRKHLSRRETEGYHSSRSWAAQHHLFSKEWDTWVFAHPRLARCLLPDQKPQQLPCSTLDGRKWNTWEAPRI